MNWDQAKQLVDAMNTIDAQRSEPQRYLTNAQYAAIAALNKVLEEEGFEVKYCVDGQAKSGWTYKIRSQVSAL